MPLRRYRVEVRAGEVLGIGGVAGNGQDELLAALSGETLQRRWHDRVSRAAMWPFGPDPAPRAGLLTAPEERLGHAAAPDMSLTENAMLTGAAREELEQGGLLDWAAARRFAEKIITEFDVRTPGPGNAARSLSGGNLQKFVIGREVLQRPTSWS